MTPRPNDAREADERAALEGLQDPARQYGARGRSSLRTFLSLLVLLFVIGVGAIFAADYFVLNRAAPAWTDAIVNAGLMTLIGSAIAGDRFMRPLRVAYTGEATPARAVL